MRQRVLALGVVLVVVALPQCKESGVPAPDGTLAQDDPLADAPVVADGHDQTALDLARDRGSGDLPQDLLVPVDTSTDALSVTPNIYDIWGSSANDVWFVGGKGTILHYDGQILARVSSTTTARLARVWGSSKTDVWAVGKGVVLHYNGSVWSKAFTPFDETNASADL